MAKDPMKGFNLLGKDGKRKRDTGIVTGLGITEDRRDQLNKRDWTRPDPANKDKNPDNWTTAECKSKKFSGIRNNRINGMTEIWAAGRMLADARTSWVGNDPARLATLHEKAFGTDGTILSVDLPTKRITVPSKRR